MLNLIRFRYAKHIKKNFNWCIRKWDWAFKLCLRPKAQNIDFKIIWEMLKRAQPTVYGNNLVCELCLKKLKAVVYASLKEGCLIRRVILYFFSEIWKSSKISKVFYSHLFVVFVHFSVCLDWRSISASNICTVQYSIIMSCCVFTCFISFAFLFTKVLFILS